jgi:hypothetical protein
MGALASSVASPFFLLVLLLQPVRPLPRLSSEATKKGAVTPHPRYPGQ